MKGSLSQQIIAGAAIVLVVTATLAGGLLLAWTELPAATADRATPTRPMATLTLIIRTGEPVQPPTATVRPVETEGARSSVTPVVTVTPYPTVTLRPTRTSASSGGTGAGPAPVLPTETSLPPSPTSGPVVDTTATQTATDGLCRDRNSVITSPAVGAVLSGEQAFYGSAIRQDFSYYKLEIRQEGTTTPADFVTFYTGETPVQNGLLGILLTPAFTDGEYWIRLTVVDSTGNYLERCSILYVIDN